MLSMKKVGQTYKFYLTTFEAGLYVSPEAATWVQFPVQVKPLAREAKALLRCLKMRADCRKASWRVSHPGSGLQDAAMVSPPHGFSSMG